MNILEVHNVSKAFGGIQALNTCSLTVEQGKITGLIGPNGSGKTTLFNVITGYEHVDSGEVQFNGRRITNSSPDKVGSAPQFAGPAQSLEFHARAATRP